MIIKFWKDLAKKSSIQTEDKILIGNETTRGLNYVDIGDVQNFIAEDINAKAALSYYELAQGVTVLPVPPMMGGVPMDRAWVWLTQGVTYTQAGGPALAAPLNRQSRADWNGSSWSLKDMGTLPDSSAKFKPWGAGYYNENEVVVIGNNIFRANKYTNQQASPNASDWDVMGAYTGIVNDMTATVNFNGTTDKFSLDGTFAVIAGNKRYVATVPLEIDLISDSPAVLYIRLDGSIGTISTGLLGSMPGDAIVFATYRKISADRYVVNGLGNYSINGIGQTQNNYFDGILLGTPNGFQFDTVNNTISTSGTTLAVYLNKRAIVVPQSQTIPLPATGSYVLYVTQDGVLNTIEQSLIGNIPFGSIKIGGFNRAGSTALFVSGINNYSINGISQTRQNYFEGILQGAESGCNFDTVGMKVKFSSTNVVIYENRRIVISPQAQELDLVASGIYVLYANQDGTIGSILQSSIGNIPFGAVKFATYQYTGSLVFVTGIDNYSINGIPARYIGKAVGKLVTKAGNINIVGQTLEITSGMLIIGNNRYNIAAQSVPFSASPSIFYYVPSTGLIGTSQSGSINMPTDAIMFAGHYGAVGARFEFWGIENYLVKGFNKIFWEKKLVQKKLLTDFNPIDYYYLCDTTLSMTSSDPEPLIGSDPNIMNARYDALMATYPDLFEKETIANINTGLGLRPINVYTFTPPSVSTEPRPDAGVVVIEQPHVFINCSIHGSEKTASIACYQFIEDMLTKWQDNKVLEWFRFNVKISIIPTANPAGWVNGTRGNGNLVDLNRNFPYRYIPNYNPGQSTWSGNAALDQPESLAINTWMEANKNKLLLVIDFHNFFGTEGTAQEWDILQWTESVSQYTNQLGRVAAQIVSRGSRGSSSFFPSDYNKMLGTASYVSNPIGRLAGQGNDICPYGLTFEISQNFRFNPNFKPNDNDAIRLGAEAFGNSLTQFIWHCMQDYNSKEATYDSL